MQVHKIDPVRLYDGSGSGFSTSIQCVICHEVALNPKECETCQNLLCEECLVVWREIKDICPCFCSEQPLKVKPAHKFIRDMIGNLKVKCVNFEHGCKDPFRFESLPSHEQSQCLFRKITCPKQLCKQEFFIKDLDSHNQVCFIEEIECPGCKVRYLKSEFGTHQCVTSLFAIAKSLEEKCKENNEKIKLLEANLDTLGLEHKKKMDLNGLIGKSVTKNVKDLKLYMKSEVESVIQGILKENKEEKNVALKNSLPKINEKKGFTSKFLTNFKDLDEDDSVSDTLDPKQPEEEEIKGKVEPSESDSEEHKGNRQKKCHDRYQNLTWLVEPEKNKCGICGSIKLIRYKCSECLKKLCVKCKRPNFKKGICPIGHELVKMKSQEEAECDICAGNIKKGVYCYTDHICGADVCLNCFST